MRSLALFIPLLLSGSGCHIFFGDDDDPCESGDVAYPSPGVRNPTTGLCENQSGGGGTCDTEVAALLEPGAPAEDPIAQDWASCDGVCETLDETTCQATDGCRAAYMEPCPAGTECYLELAFIGCWGTAPSGPIRGGGCTGLDAYTCSIHDDCRPVHSGAGETYGDFLYCLDEEVPCDSPLGDAWLRNPETGACEPFGVDLCGGVKTPYPDFGACYAECEGLDETTCAASDACRAIFVDACPTCDALVLEYAACWPTAPSGPIRGGDCFALNAMDCSRHDDCSAVHQQDWDLCPPDAPCEWTPLDFAWCQPEVGVAPACEEITDERLCVESAGCQPVYEGSDCSCDDTGCTCLTWTFQACQSGG